MTTRDDEQCMKLGREIVRMIRDVRKISKGLDAGYARRTFTFPGGEVQILVTDDGKVADSMERGVSKDFAISTATPPSTLN